MRSNGNLYYPLTDHLGSTTVTTDASGVVVSELRSKPFASCVTLRRCCARETRSTSGTTPTGYKFTGQFSNESDFGLYFYNARWLDPALGRFSQADTFVADNGNTLDYDRYGYARSNPIKYNDPSGHVVTEGCGDDGKEHCVGSEREKAEYEYWRQRNDALKCQGGNKTYCSNAENHPVEVTAYTISGLVLAAAGAAAITTTAYTGEIITTATTSACIDGDCINEIEFLDDTFYASYRQLQHLYSRHGSDFGFNSSWSGSTTPAQMETTIVNHINNPNTEMILGTYRGYLPVMHLYNSTTTLNIMFQMDGTLVSGWKLSSFQILNLFGTGNVQ